MMDTRMIKVSILDTEYPMCYTVAAADRMERELGGLPDVWNADTTLIAAEILLEGGEHRYAWLTAAQPRQTPTADRLRQALTPGQLPQLLKIVLTVIHDGLKTTVETAPKNGEATQVSG